MTTTTYVHTVKPEARGTCQWLARKQRSWLQVIDAHVNRALDDGATEIVVTFGVPNEEGLPSYFEVKDNGRGTDKARRIIAPGACAYQTSELAFWLGGEAHTVEIETVSQSECHRSTHKWADCIEANEWLTTKTKVTQAESGVATGTTIRAHPVVREMPRAAAWRKLVDELGYRFTPALNSGHRIALTFAGEVFEVGASNG